MAPSNRDDGNWLASLARQSASTDNTTKPNNTSKRKKKGSGGKGGGKDKDKESRTQSDAAAPTPPLTKAQRIAKREQKRIEREERKRITEDARQQRLAKKRQKLKPASAAAGGSSRTHHHGHNTTDKKKGPIKRGMTPLSKQALNQLSTILDSTIETHAEQFVANQKLQQQQKRQSTKRNKKNNNDNADDTPQPELSNGLPSEPKGKATRQGTLRPESRELQPRIRDYNGQGLVRPSLYLPFNDPSFLPKLELEFAEHVPGFFGKSKQKAAKKQSDEKMLWKRCLKAKSEEEEELGKGEEGRKTKKKKKSKKGLESMMKEGVM